MNRFENLVDLTNFVFKFGIYGIMCFGPLDMTFKYLNWGYMKSDVWYDTLVWVLSWKDNYQLFGFIFWMGEWFVRSNFDSILFKWVWGDFTYFGELYFFFLSIICGSLFILFIILLFK